MQAQESEAAKPLQDYAELKTPDALIVHSGKTIETKRDFIGTRGITPNSIAFVGNNLSPPDAEVVGNADSWEVSFEGFARPRSMTLGELKKMGTATVAAVLQCSGDGRALFDHNESGTPWSTGAAANVLWNGIPLRTVVDALGGPVQAAKFMTNTGGETLPEVVDPKAVVVERLVPLGYAIENVILAWEMNGVPVPLAHDGPLRVVTPGYYGVNNVKYVRRLTLTEAGTDAKIMASGCRVRPDGVEGAPDQPTMWETKVKSWVTHPLVDTAFGKICIHGIAFGGINALKNVEVTANGGRTWQPTELLGPDMGRFAWWPFVLMAGLPAGEHVIASRATDSEGRAQEETTEPNHRGHDYSGWERLAVEVTLA